MCIYYIDTAYKPFLQNPRMELPGFWGWRTKERFDYTWPQLDEQTYQQCFRQELGKGWGSGPLSSRIGVIHQFQRKLLHTPVDDELAGLWFWRFCDNYFFMCDSRLTQNWKPPPRASQGSLAQRLISGCFSFFYVPFCLYTWSIWHSRLRSQSVGLIFFFWCPINGKPSNVVQYGLSESWRWNQVTCGTRLYQVRTKFTQLATFYFNRPLCQVRAPCSLSARPVSPNSWVEMQKSPGASGQGAPRTYQNSQTHCSI